MSKNRPPTSNVNATSTLPDTLTSKSTSIQKKRHWLPLALVILVIISSILGIALLYQNHVNQVNTAIEQAHKTATATGQVKATATAQHNAYLSALSGDSTLVFSDSLSQESQWWHTATDGDTTCQFEGTAYHIKPQGRYFFGCDASGTYSNFAFEVQLTILEGDCAGIVFRDNGTGKFYYFSIYQDGKYDIARYADYGIFEHLLPYGRSAAIRTGLGQQNKIAVKANGSTLTFYVNEQEIQQLQDASGYTEGSIGLAAYPNIGNGADVRFSNARLWTL